MELKNGQSSYACFLPCECDYLSNFQFTTFITSLLKNSFFDMKIFKLVAWFLNMVQPLWNDMVQYTVNFHKN
jgi:hypothetical protein